MREHRPMSNAQRLVTADEFERAVREDDRCELVEGRVVPMTTVSLSHARTVIRIGALLDAHVRSHRIPVFVAAELGCKLSMRTVRAPDVAIVRRERVSTPDERGFLNGPPDVAIEVVSPGDRPREIDEKVSEYLASGTPLVVVIDPEQQDCRVFRPDVPSITLGSEDALDLGGVVPGFSCCVAEIFGS
jgi:Uma2 family endonuclease